MDELKKILEQLKAINNRLDKRKRMTIVISAILTIAVIITLVSLTNHIRYEVLFSGLDPGEAGTIVTKLKESGVSYQLKNGGSTILVPDSQVYDLRLDLASQGLPQSGSVGYEIFDKNNIGSTDFVQKINYRRALEGELARTIATLSEVVAARVHLVIPEDRLFVEEKKETTASITLKLKPGRTLSVFQIQGIANLVSASVEGLHPDAITIIDSNSNLLSQPHKSNSLIAMSSNQMEMKQSVENYYGEKLKSVLEQVVGKNRVAVQVAVELNFDQVERTIEKYDPDNVVVISEQRDSQVTNSADGKTPQKSENTVTNYEVNKTVEKIVQDVGNIKRISAAVMVDGKYVPPPAAAKNTPPQYVPLAANELNQMQEIVKSAIGYSAERQDEVKVVNMPFDRTQVEQEKTELTQFEKKIFWEKIIRWVVYLLLALVVVYALWRVIKAFKTVLTSNPTQQPSTFSIPTSSQEAIEMELLPEMKNNLELQKSIAGLTKKNPDDAAKLLKAWLAEDAHA